MQLTEVVEDMLKENGGIYSKSGNWEVYVFKGGNLITEQNPTSSNKASEQIYEMLK